MRSSLLKPKSLSVDAMSSRLKILNNYLASFPSLDNKSVLHGEMIENMPITDLQKVDLAKPDMKRLNQAIETQLKDEVEEMIA